MLNLNYASYLPARLMRRVLVCSGKLFFNRDLCNISTKHDILGFMSLLMLYTDYVFHPVRTFKAIMQDYSQLSRSYTKFSKGREKV